MDGGAPFGADRHARNTARDTSENGVAALDPALLATPCGCSTPGDCLEVGCAGRCGRVGA